MQNFPAKPSGGLLRLGSPSPAVYCFAVVVLLGLVCAACALSLQLHMKLLSGFDVSPMVDGGWRVYSGQSAAHDFIGTFPASLSLAVAAAYRLFGLTWHSIGVAASLQTLLLCLLGARLVALLRPFLGRGSSLFLFSIYSLSQITILIYINYLWHASMVQHFGAYAVLAVFVLLIRPPSRRVQAEIFLHLLLALSVLLLSKPNTAFPTILLCFVVLALSNRVPKVFVFLLGGSVLLLGSALLRFAHTDLWHMLLQYRGLSGRLIPKPLFVGFLYKRAFSAVINLITYVALAPLAFLAFQLARNIRSRHLRNPAYLLAGGACLITVLGFATNFDYKLTDTPLMMLGLSLLAVTLQRSTHLLRFRLQATASGFLIIGLFFGVTRIRMALMGDWAREGCEVTPVTDTFLKGMRACEGLQGALDEAHKAVAEAGPHPHVFFGPDLEFMYVDNQVPSALHMPLWWDPGTSYPLAGESKIVQAFKDDNFDELIFLPNRISPMIPRGIISWIPSHYILASRAGGLEVYKRRVPADESVATQ